MEENNVNSSGKIKLATSFDHQDDWNRGINSLLLLIPQEIRLDIFILLQSKDKQAVRLTCSRFNHEIDAYLGAMDLVCLDGNTDEKAMDFFSRTCYQHLKITRNGITTTPAGSEIIRHPLRLKTLTVKGATQAVFADSILASCKHLVMIMWDGILIGTLSNHGDIHLNWLKTIQLDFHPGSSNNSKMLAAWHNQINFMKRISCPLLTDVDLTVWTWAFAPADEVADEEILAEMVLGFARRSFSITSCRLVHKKWFSRELELNPRHPLVVSGNTSCALPKLDKMLGTRGVKEFSLISKCNYAGLERRLDDHVFEFLSEQEKLKIIRIQPQTSYPLSWLGTVEIINNNWHTLTHLQIQNILPLRNHENMDWIDVSKFVSLKYIMIEFQLQEDETEQEIFPRMINFGNSGLTKSLETARFVNLRFEERDLMQIPNFGALQTLSIRDWVPTTSQTFMTKRALKKILSSRSLQNLYIRVEPSFGDDGAEEIDAILDIKWALDSQYYDIDFVDEDPEIFITQRN